MNFYKLTLTTFATDDRWARIILRTVDLPAAVEDLVRGDVKEMLVTDRQLDAIIDWETQVVSKNNLQRRLDYWPVGISFIM